MLSQYFRSPLPLLAGGFRFWRQRGSHVRRAGVLCQYADGLRLHRAARWEERAPRIYRRSIRTLGELALPPAEVTDPGVAAHQALRRAREPYRALLSALAGWAVLLTTTALLVSTVAIALSPRLRAKLFPRDLAVGRPWVASGHDLGLPASGTGPSSDGPAFFHTTVMQDPSVEIDLGDEHLVRAVRVDNRADCCQERALPLNVEAWDGSAWRLIAQRRSAFTVWRHDVAPVRARRIRFRRLGTGYFHLKRVSIYGE
ncbi:MAG: hypothetical protein JXP73_09650 [Deltaproteobacteria bacterium]|jgi:hypothetical protein|nr:hypothetical protein [Deltaproteobacteria bacterium]